MTELHGIFEPAVQQAIYRKLLWAMSLPGTVQDLGEVAAGNAVTAVLATLLDGATTMADPDGLLDDDARRLVQVRAVGVADAAYVACDGSRPPAGDFRPNLGTLPSPEGGATVVLRADAVGAGELTIEVVAGPGVEMPRRVRLAGVAVEWFHRRAEWVADFPLGVDLILADERRVVAFPRTTALRIDRA